MNEKAERDWSIHHACLEVGRAGELTEYERELGYSRVRVVTRTLSALGQSVYIFAVVVDLTSLRESK